MTLIRDGGPHPSGWGFLSVPDATHQRSLMTTHLDGHSVEWGGANLDTPLITFNEVVEQWLDLDRSSVQAVAAPIHQPDAGGVWFTPLLVLERSDGSLDALGRCTSAISAELNRLITAARSDGRQGTSVDILVRELGATPSGS